MARFEFKADGEELGPHWMGEIELPDPYAPLRVQRATMRALELLFPTHTFELLSNTDQEDGGTVTRTVKMDIRRRDIHA